jgi:hypothetical protein
MIHRLKVYKEKLTRLNAEIPNTPETPSSKQVEKEVVIEVIKSVLFKSEHFRKIVFLKFKILV